MGAGGPRAACPRPERPVPGHETTGTMTDTTGDIGPSISSRTIAARAIGHDPVMALSGGTALSDERLASAAGTNEADNTEPGYFDRASVAPTAPPEVLSRIVPSGSYAAPSSALLSLLLLDPYPPKGLRKAVHRLYLTLLTDSRFKARFAAAFGAVAYRPTSTLFCAGVGTESDTLLGFTVQIFTTGSLVRALGCLGATTALLCRDDGVEEEGDDGEIVEAERDAGGAHHRPCRARQHPRGDRGRHVPAPGGGDAPARYRRPRGRRRGAARLPAGGAAAVVPPALPAGRQVRRLPVHEAQADTAPAERSGVHLRDARDCVEAAAGEERLMRRLIFILRRWASSCVDTLRL